MVESLYRRQFLKRGGAAALGLGAGPGLLAWFSRKEAGGEKVKARREAMFYEKSAGGAARCDVCFRRCRIAPGARGACRNRENRDGTLYNLVWGRPSAIHVDPVEKEPQHHFLPGTEILCFGTAGCNFHCLHCQNWHLSQNAIEDMDFCYDLSPEAAVDLAVAKKIPTISFTYNDPISFYEYMLDIARLAKARSAGAPPGAGRPRPAGRGMTAEDRRLQEAEPTERAARAETVRIMWHSNASFGREALRELLKYTDAATVDLKGFTEEFYRKVSSASLQPVLDNLKLIKASGVWLEIVNLVIPTLNDHPDDIRRMCRWVAGNLGPDVPLHFSRFHPAYRLKNLPPTPVKTLERTHRIAREEGLRFVSIGNVPGHEHNSTFCPACGKRLVHRVHFEVLEHRIENGNCPFCGATIPGVWS